MNFFESQERVRKNTSLLVLLFGLAVIALVIVTNVLVMFVFGYINNAQISQGQAAIPAFSIATFDWTTFAVVGLGVSAVIFLGSLYKMATLSAGGKVVAESLGGQLIPQNTKEPEQRKLLNVVEEMAIASGTPAPPVYLLAKEQGINAFAAGLTPRDAVIGVTRGAIEHLNREQLQGVIAHEFSHIFNGDMRLNIRLMGALHGILILGILGYYLLYSSSFSGRRRGNDKGAAAILALAIGLMVIGYAGTFFGALIKASVSRQREYLADASSVQFTRNPNGIAGALKRIGGLSFGSKVESPGAAEVSHAFFAQGVSGFMQGLASTHPPLAKRILRVDPHWDGKFDTTDQSERSSHTSHAANAQASVQSAMSNKTAAVTTAVSVAQAVAAISHIGQPQQQVIEHVQSLLDELPRAIVDAAREPYGARALIYGLVLDPDAEQRGQQLDQLLIHADSDVYALTLRLVVPLQELDARYPDKRYRLPLINMAIPALKQLSLSQYESFRENLLALIASDGKVDLIEWSLQKILFNHLDQQFFQASMAKVYGKARGKTAMPDEQSLAMLLSVVAHVGTADHAEQVAAFSQAAQELQLRELAFVTEEDISGQGLDQALATLEQMPAAKKLNLLKACASCIAFDQQIAPLEAELLRAFAGALDWPLPPSIGWPGAD